MQEERKYEMWEHLLSQMHTSSQTNRKWCQENGISYSSMRRWERKLSKESKNFTENTEGEKVGWLEISRGETTGTVAQTNIRVVIGEFSIEVTENFNSSIFTEICKVLQTLC